MKTDLKSWKSPKVEVRESETEGKGLYANKKIEKGEIVFVKGGHIVEWEECKELAEKFGDYYLQIEENLFLAPKTEKEVESTTIFINHSCNPNVAPDGQIVFKTINPVEKGEELCYDYAMTTAHEYELNCSCGTEQCRGKITGEDWKKKQLQQKYDDNFSNFILNKIQRREVWDDA